MAVKNWPQLSLLVRLAGSMPTLEVWLFGSALRHDSPADIDILLVYSERESVLTLRSIRRWEEFEPPCHIIAMTPGEVEEYAFVARTGALRLA